MNLLSRLVAAVPARFRHRVGSTRAAQLVLRTLFGSRRVVRSTPEKSVLHFHPIYHAELLALADLTSYEPEVRRTLSHVVRPGQVAYDVGANVGLFTSLLSHLVGEGGRVVAFEPEENNASCLEASVRHSPLPNVTLERRAVGRSTGSENFDHRGGAFSGRLVGPGGYAVTQNVTAVAVISLDDYVAGGASPPDLVKIDVEGNELLVLQGMTRLLREHRPMILCEVHAHLGESPQAVVDLLHQHGYELIAPETVLLDEPSRIRHLEGRDWLLARSTDRAA